MLTIYALQLLWSYIVQDDPQPVQFQTYTAKTNNDILEVHAQCGLLGKKAQ